MPLNVIILAAGLGSRLGSSDVPKPLTLVNGTSIFERQIRNLVAVFGPTISITVMVGYKEEAIRTEAVRLSKALRANYIRCLTNTSYASTNTSQSLLRGLQALPPDTDVLWLNGDVVFDAEILRSAQKLIFRDNNFIVVNNSSVAEEEVKYVTNEAGQIIQLSKIVSMTEAEGEAVGINFANKETVPVLIEALKQVEHQDYFEAGMMRIIEQGIIFTPHNISIRHLRAYEVDSPSDLVEVKSIFNE